MPLPKTPQLLRRHATVFTVAFAALTAALIANYAATLLPQLSARGATPGTMVEALLLAVPFTAAMTIPMAVFIAVLWVFMRLGSDGTLDAARREGNVHRLVVPVLGAAAGIAAVMLVSNTQILPRANGRLAELASGAPVRTNDRAMTVGELRTAALKARTDGSSDGAARAVGFEVEIQKKFVLAASCVVLALFGAALALRFPRGGAALVIGSSLAIFGGYYFALTTGETLADRLVVSPVVAMWMANDVLLAAALIIVWRRRGPTLTREAESIAIGV